jgi:hypothetical protein
MAFQAASPLRRVDGPHRGRRFGAVVWLIHDLL